MRKSCLRIRRDKRVSIQDFVSSLADFPVLVRTIPNLITCEAPTTQESRGSSEASQVEMSTLLRLDRLVFREKPSVLKGLRPSLQWGSNRPTPEYRRGAQSGRISRRLTMSVP